MKVLPPQASQRIRQLHALIGSPNGNEADVARRKLNELLARYDLSWNDLPDLLAATEVSSSGASYTRDSGGDEPNASHQHYKRPEPEPESHQKYEYRSAQPQPDNGSETQSQSDTRHINSSDGGIGGLIALGATICAVLTFALITFSENSPENAAARQREQQKNEMVRQQQGERQRQQEAERQRQQDDERQRRQAEEWQRQKEAERQRQQDAERQRRQQEDTERRQQQQKAAALQRLEILRCLNGNGTCCPLGQTPTSILNQRTYQYEMHCRQVRFGE